MGRFYFFFMQFEKILVTALCRFVRMDFSTSEMNKLLPQFQVPSKVTRTNPKLIVLIPSGLNLSVTSRQIWQLATVVNMPVLLLSLGRVPKDEPGVRRELVTIMALLRGERLAAEMKIEIGRTWIGIVRAHYQSGDLVVCPATCRTGVPKRFLVEILGPKMNITVCDLADLCPQNKAPNEWGHILVWPGLFGLLAGFGILQFEIVRLTGGGFQSLLLILSTILEFWLFGVWSNLFSQV